MLLRVLACRIVFEDFIIVVIELHFVLTRTWSGICLQHVLVLPLLLGHGVLQATLLDLYCGAMTSISVTRPLTLFSQSAR